MAQSFLYDHRGEVARIVHVEDPSDFLSPFTIETRQDVEPVLAYAKAMRDVEQNGNYRFVGTMPIADAERMMLDGSFNDPTAIARYFADSDHALLRGS